MTFKNKINDFLHFFGYCINRVDSTIIDVRDKGNDPRQMYYTRGQILINAPTNRGRFRFFPLSNTNNPFVHGVAKCINESDKYTIVETTLREHYNLIQPKNIFDWYSIDEEDAPSLIDVPVWAAPEPWKQTSIEEKLVSMKKVAANESKKYKKSLSIFDGDKGFGPVSDEKLQLETIRLIKVMNSIINKGYKRHNGKDGDIQAFIFMREDGNWSWQVSGGFHRAAVLAGLKWQFIPVRVVSIINRNDVDIWPNVLSDIYTKKGALKIFDKIFNGSIPIILEDNNFKEIKINQDV